MVLRKQKIVIQSWAGNGFGRFPEMELANSFVQLRGIAENWRSFQTWLLLAVLLLRWVDCFANLSRFRLGFRDKPSTNASRSRARCVIHQWKPSSGHAPLAIEQREHN